jgi:ferrochelatase
MKVFDKKTAIILFNLGGPDSLKSVQPFLFNLFNDAAIISLPQPLRFFFAKLISTKRAKKAQKIYAQIGGRSPLLNISLSQAYALERELSFFGNFKVFVAMRYWRPRASEVIKEIKKYDPNQLILLPLYPQFSSATSNSSLQEFIKKYLFQRQKNDKKITTKIVCCYPAEPAFIKAHSFLIKQTISKVCEKNLSRFRFLFSAHGLPQKLINAGDPYVFQVTETAKKIVKNLAEIFLIHEEEIDFQICYQSKVGCLQWTSPSLDYELRRVALDKKIPVVVPISFVSDHAETLVELDIDYKNLAQGLGIKNYFRVPALNLDGHFIKSLVEICKAVDSNNESQIFSGQKSERICPKSFKFCLNQNHCEA